MKQRLHRQQPEPIYVAHQLGYGFCTSSVNYEKMNDRQLMQQFCHDHLYANMSTNFIRICAELGARGYNPEYKEIRSRLR